MDATIAYDTVIGLLANPPSLGSRPNFFNLRELRLHYARALKKVPCPQSAINGWAGAVLSPAMYALIDTTPFHWNISTTAIPEFPARFALLPDGTNGAELPYSPMTPAPTFVVPCSTHSTRMSATSSSPPRPARRALSVGIRRCFPTTCSSN